MQTKVQSFVESLLNIIVGSIVALISQLIIFPLYGIHVDLATDLYIVVWFTIISIVRSYILRRVFNRLHRVRE